MRGIVGGEFKFDLVLEGTFNVDGQRNFNRSVFTKKTGKPRFLYSHSPNPGHTQNSGKCLADEKERFHEKLVKANSDILEDIRLIKSTNREAIIIIAGDHGPYLTGDCKHLTGFSEEDITNINITDRYGTFLAIQWPKTLKPIDEKIKILQDVFASVLSTLADDKALFEFNQETKVIGNFLKGSVDEGKIQIGPDKGQHIL